MQYYYILFPIFVQAPAAVLVNRVIRKLEVSEDKKARNFNGKIFLNHLKGQGTKKKKPRKKSKTQKLK